MTEELPGRQDLIAWTQSRPRNYYERSTNLTAILHQRAGATRLTEMEPRLHAFGEAVAQVIEPAVVVLERHRDLPALVAYDPVGRRIDQVEFHPDHYVATAAVWDSGLLASDVGAGGAFEQAALFYLLSHVGEGGIACPAVCTAGLGRALAHRGSPELRERYLGGVRSSTYAGALRGSQFLTEVQGGSDVGANLVVARPDEIDDEAWRITGEKWFCSVADADLFVVTARPDGARDGTKGLGCFIVPRTLDGVTPNGFRIRQLKDKLGTRALASAEIDFDAALGWPIGDVDEGFSVAVEELLNTSRWLNAVGSTGLMRRAYVEAVSFARHRRAFGRPIITMPIVAQQLATMKVEEMAALSSTMALTALIDRMDRGVADERDVAVHRFLVNVNKFQTSRVATDMVHQGIEILGGNGTIESFSALPRLYRDAVVYESWEGTHNVLCAQVRRDCERLALLDHVTPWILGELESLDGDEAGIVRSVVTDLDARFTAATGDGDAGAYRVRRLVERYAHVIQAASLLSEAAVGDGVKRAAASMFVASHFGTALDEGSSPDLVAAVLGDDL